MSRLPGAETAPHGKDKVTSTGLKTRKLTGEKITALTAMPVLLVRGALLPTEPKRGHMCCHPARRARWP